MIEVAPSLQRNWDARAAGNFSFGGAGAGALILAALEHALGGPYRLPAAAGLALIATGLFCVWLEIGRPLRAANVLRQPQLSWMSRESLAAPLLFATGIAALWFGGGALAWVTAFLAAVFLYCQARMLRAAKGIPAWRNPLIVPLIASSGLCEGLGLWLALAAIAGVPAPRWMAGLLAALALARALAWRAYRAKLEGDGAPAASFAALRSIKAPMSLIGAWATILLSLIGFAAPLTWATWIAALAGLCALGTGWLLKFTLITRAAYNQGFALARLPVRGAGSPGPAFKPGWH
ncbi:MAG: dimethyl sulfoxide reductase anchor subunit [Betaproteobacteria bacterium]|nr:dimethyl sulfoxide reductase anchor subunit [Betaproteobacteria bacterium]